MTIRGASNKQLNTAILFLIFNRPDATRKVFERIRKARPQRLYIASDGPRLLNDSDIQKVIFSREISMAVDWKCEVKTLFRKENLGCKSAVESAITWFFNQEEEGIILEDDCLPNADFFLFCEKLLEKYRNNKKVLTILGCNFQEGKIRGAKSYYFSKYFHCWGWASWRRTWTYYDGKISFWPKWKESDDWTNKFTDKVEQQYWGKIFDKIYLNQIDTWDYPFIACLWNKKKDGLNVTPNVNLVSNIGFGKDASHTNFSFDKYSNLPASSIADLTHPTEIEWFQLADKYTFDNVFDNQKSLKNLPIRILKYFLVKLKKINGKIEK